AFLVDHVAVDEGCDEREEADDGEHSAEAEPGAAAFRVRHGLSSQPVSPFAVCCAVWSGISLVVEPATLVGGAGEVSECSVGGAVTVSAMDRRRLTWVIAGA